MRPVPGESKHPFDQAYVLFAINYVKRGEGQQSMEDNKPTAQYLLSLSEKEAMPLMGSTANICCLYRWYRWYLLSLSLVLRWSPGRPNHTT